MLAVEINPSKIKPIAVALSHKILITLTSRKKNHIICSLYIPSYALIYIQGRSSLYTLVLQDENLRYHVNYSRDLQIIVGILNGQWD